MQLMGQNVRTSAVEIAVCCLPAQAFSGSQRLYLPVFWVRLMNEDAAGWRPALQQYINKLDRRQAILL